MLASTHYETLGVSPSAEPSVVRAAYKVLIQSHHPDRHTGEAAKRAHARTLAINAAWAVLSQPALRQAYDAVLAQASKPAVTPEPSSDAAHVVAMAEFRAARRQAEHRQRGAETWAQAAAQVVVPAQVVTNPTGHDLLAQWLDAQDRVLATRLVRAGARVEVRLAEPARTLQVAYNPVAHGGGHYTAEAWQRVSLTGTSAHLPVPPQAPASSEHTWGQLWQALGNQRWWLVPMGALGMALGTLLV